ncbi:MAG TPA: ATP-binding protein [Ktedonobacteraceae bacterium]|nr:ATP-binding protein [Ktedonobacteraceae bacterium]
MQPQSNVTESAYRPLIIQDADRLAALRQQMEYLNTIGKRFVAAYDRIQVHRALLTTLQELYSFSACSILVEGDPIELTFDLSIIPRYPLSETFLQAMMERIARAAEVMGFPGLTPEELGLLAYLDAPDEIVKPDPSAPTINTIGDMLNIPLTVENRIIGILSLFDEHEGAFDTEQLQLTTMIADYAAVALENVRLRERERALWQEAELGRSRLELIISSMAEGLLITNAQGAVISLNSSAQHLFDQAQVHLVTGSTIPLHQLAASQDIPWLSDLADIVQQALTGKIIMNRQLIIGTSGETVPLTLSISASPLYDTDQTHTQLLGVVAVLNDITSSKQVEKLKDEFVSIVSHELRTPLTAIKGYTQHLIRRIERRLRGVQKAQPVGSTLELPESYDLRSLNIIQSQTDHLERLVNDLLDLSRVQWGELHLQYSSFYLADVLAECVQSAQASAEQHVIYLDIETQDSKIVADKLRVCQVIGNILDNAIKFSPQGKQVRVRLQEQDNEYLVSVIDQGIGVSPEHFDHIFERFYRVRNTASRQYSGIGMGLYVAKAIVEAHGGRIWLSSNQGVGSIFYFTLPRVPRTTTLQ